jgi:hypothetical protein
MIEINIIIQKIKIHTLLERGKKFNLKTRTRVSNIRLVSNDYELYVLF